MEGREEVEGGEAEPCTRSPSSVGGTKRRREGLSLLGPCRSGPPCSISVLPLLGPHREPSSPTLLPVTLESFHANVTWFYPNLKPELNLLNYSVAHILVPK